MLKQKDGPRSKVILHGQVKGLENRLTGVSKDHRRSDTKNTRTIHHESKDIWTELGDSALDKEFKNAMVSTDGSSHHAHMALSQLPDALSDAGAKTFATASQRPWQEQGRYQNHRSLTSYTCHHLYIEQDRYNYIDLT